MGLARPLHPDRRALRRDAATMSGKGGDGLDVLTTGKAEGWDAMLLVHYPRRTAFNEMVQDPQYQEAVQVGKSALADTAQQTRKIA